MKEKLKKILTILVFTLIIIQGTTYAHSGRTDSSGGHKDNQNKSGLGSYHYHCGGHPPHLHTNGVCPYSSNGGTSSKPASSSTTNKNNNSNTNNSLNKTTTTTPTVISVEKVEIQEKNDLELIVGNTLKLTANIQPTNATNKSITWESSDNKIATVDSNGNVLAISEGTVTIYAKSNNSKQDYLVLTIKDVQVIQNINENKSENISENNNINENIIEKNDSNNSTNTNEDTSKESGAGAVIATLGIGTAGVGGYKLNKKRKYKKNL